MVRTVGVTSSVCLLCKQDKVLLKWDPTHFTRIRRDENFTVIAIKQSAFFIPVSF